MIINFKNLEKNPEFSYLEDPITEAVRNELKAKLDFREMQRADIRGICQITCSPFRRYTQDRVHLRP